MANEVLSAQHATARQSAEADVARVFGIAPDSFLHASLGIAEISHSVTTIRPSNAPAENCVVFDSCLEEVNAENAVIFGSQIKSLQIQGGLCYNVVSPQAQLASGDILAGIRYPSKAISSCAPTSAETARKIGINVSAAIPTATVKLHN